MARTVEENAHRREDDMTIRVATIEVSHWHALNDAAYLRHLIAMPDVELGRAFFAKNSERTTIFAEMRFRGCTCWATLERHAVFSVASELRTLQLSTEV
jgi:hypothetical protein